MKRFISLILCAVMVFSGCMVAMAYEDKTPIIIIPGFLEPQMSMNIDKINEKALFPPSVPSVAGKIVADFPNLATALGALIIGRGSLLGKTMAIDAIDIMQNLICNPDGTTKHKVETFPNDPALCNAKYLSKHKAGKYLPMAGLVKDLAAKSNPERVFVFNYDSRYDSIKLAGQLRTFIKAVKKYCNSDKVRLCSHSYGGQIIATYLYKYLNDGDIKKVVMIYPALGGTAATSQLLESNPDVPLDEMIVFLESLVRTYAGIEKAFQGPEYKTLNDFVRGGLLELNHFWKYWSSMYSLCSTENYERQKKEFLDPVKSAKIIKANDTIHYEIMPNLSKVFRNCQAKGISVSIIAGSGRKECFGGDANTDILLPTDLTTGAYCAKYGKHFKSDYKAKGTACNNPKHNHISPAKNIDASTAFLPENTWFIEGAFHGAYSTENYATSLIEELLLTDNIKNVRSDSRFPQFNFSDNVNMGIRFAFDASSAGYISAKDSSLVIKNLSKTAAIKIISVKADGTEIRFDVKSPKIILPGKSVSIPFSLSFAKANGKRADITVKYAEGLEIKTKTRSFSVYN